MAMMPKVESRFRYVEHVEAKGENFYRLAALRGSRRSVHESHPLRQQSAICLGDNGDRAFRRSKYPCFIAGGVRAGASDRLPIPNPATRRSTSAAIREASRIS